MKIGVLGGTGPAGSALATRLVSVGHEVVIGSRSRERADETCQALVAQWHGHDLSGLTAGENRDAAACDVIVVATPWDGAAPTVAGLSELLEGKVIISMANALTRVGKEFQPLIPPRGSVAADIAAAIPKSKVAAAFHHVPAKELGELEQDVDCDVLVCSDHPEATSVTTALIADIPGMRALDAGRLASAGPIESLTAILIGMNVRYRTRLSIKLSGIDDASLDAR